MPLKILPQATSPVVGGREARKKQTAIVGHGAYHLQLSKEYMDNQPSLSHTFLPLCHANARGPYVDLRIHRALVFLFQIHSQCNAGSYTAFLDGLQDRTAADRYHNRTGNTLMWSNHEPTAQYWDHAASLPETTVTITTVPGPHGRWVDIGLTA